MNIESQTKKIKEQLIKGSGITPQHALNRFGCMRLAARIKDLRDAGMNIRTRMVKHNGKRFAYYELAE